MTPAKPDSRARSRVISRRVIDSIEPIARRQITRDLARESGFASVKDLLEMAQHGSGRNVYLIRFHYLPPGGWDQARGR